ncbi:amidohydrolase [bacterium]|nr:amidohydrolase [bacterium]
MEALSPSLTDGERSELLRLRRDFHRFPELGFQERRTAGIIAEFLRGLGLAPSTGVAETGVVTLINPDAEGPTLLLRADMDALPIHEIDGRDYGSAHAGVMHACGHDGHCATLLTACSVLKRESASLGGRVKVIFQPAEEGLGGARRMIEEGVLDAPRVDAALGLHFWSGLPTGQVSVSPGATMAAVDEFHLRIVGRGGHAAHPHETCDPVVAGAALVTALQTLVSRRHDPLHSLVVTVGEFHAGSAFNIIPGEARLSGTVRCFDKAIWEAIPEQLEHVAAGICHAHGCGYELDYQRQNIPLVNDVAMAELVRETAVDLLGADKVLEVRTLGGEDMADVLDRVPGCFFFVGSGSEAKGITAGHHHPAFDLDEDALAIGVELLVRAARRYFAG